VCNLDELDAICAELIINWGKHGGHTSGNHDVWFRLYTNNEFVALEFGDSFGGKFDLESWGGIRAARELCERYGGFLESRDPDENGHKALILWLWLIPHGMIKEVD
jgi:hypothetical protein